MSKEDKESGKESRQNAQNNGKTRRKKEMHRLPLGMSHLVTQVSATNNILTSAWLKVYAVV